MAVTLTALQLETYRLLNENSNTTLGEVGDGSGSSGSLASSSATTITQWLNEGVYDFVRACVPMNATATVSQAASTPRVAYTGLTMAAAYSSTLVYLWYATSLSIGGTAVTFCGENELRLYNPALENVANSVTTLYWYRHGDHGVGIYPARTSTTTITVNGYALPKILGDGSGSTVTSYSFLPDDLMLRAFPAYAAAKIAMKNTDDPGMLDRMVWKDWYEQAKAEQWESLDSSLRAPGGPFSNVPLLLRGKRK